MYSHTDSEIYLGLYGGSQTTIPLAGGDVAIKQTTEYPFKGKIVLKIDPSADQRFTLKLRIPTWAREQFVPGKLYHYVDHLKPAWTLKVNGRRLTPDILNGFASIDRTWTRGDTETVGDAVKPSTVRLIPYYAWNNRGEESMIVWLPRKESLARKYMVSNQLAASKFGSVRATHTHEGDTVAAVVDGRVPDKSADPDQPRWTSLPFKNRGENIVLEFENTQTVGSISIFWYEEAEGEKVRLPRDWWVDYRIGQGDWTRMKKYVSDDYGKDPDQFNVVRPAAPLKCDALSIRILPQVGFCMGVHEIDVQFDKKLR